jgi:hypothetical protein
VNAGMGSAGCVAGAALTLIANDIVNTVASEMSRIILGRS